MSRPGATPVAEGWPVQRFGYRFVPGWIDVSVVARPWTCDYCNLTNRVWNVFDGVVSRTR